MSELDVSLLLSKALSIAIIAGSLTLQAPQIYKIVKAKSAAGLSALGWATSASAMALNICYNVREANPFTTWGENVFIIVQLAVLIVLKRHYDNASVLGSAAFFGYLALLFLGCMQEAVPTVLLVSIPVPLSCLSSLPQLLHNFRSGHTGQLALLPTMFATLGLTIRVFTTAKEVSDPLALVAVVVPTVLNSLMLIQLLTMPGGDTAAKRD